MVQRTLTRAEAEASRLLQRAQAMFADYGEPWPGYRVDVLLLAGLVFELGIQAVSDLRVDSREYAAFLTADSKLIVVEANHHEHRRRFSIAHEIGHYVLHYLPKTTPQLNFHCSSGDMELSSTPDTKASTLMHHHLRQEWEANVFAGELLMPAGPVLAMFKATRGSIPRLAAQFHVSPKAMEIRLKGLPVPFAPKYH